MPFILPFYHSTSFQQLPAIWGGHQVDVGRRADAGQVEAVGVPADPDRRVAAHLAAIVMGHGVFQGRQPAGVQAQYPIVIQLLGEPGGPGAVLRVPALVPPPAVVQQGEQPGDLQVAARCLLPQHDGIPLPLQPVPGPVLGPCRIKAEYLLRLLQQGRQIAARDRRAPVVSHPPVYRNAPVPSSPMDAVLRPVFGVSPRFARQTGRKIR